MIFLRSLLYQVVLIGSIVVYSLAIMVVGWRGPNPLVARLARAWARANLRALKAICGLDYRIHGLDQLPREAAVVLCKHQSVWDTIGLRAFLPLEQSWVLKQELTRLPIFGWALSRLHPISIDRSAGRREITRLIREGTGHLDAGRWVIVFPEGTRVAPGARHPYGIGGALLAERSGRPVVPIAHNAGVFWGRRGLTKRPGVIDVVIGPALISQGCKATEINATIEQWIEQTVADLPGG
jgi:1-acyl-sn-glycerol-3-phosphate acyltransferase